MTIPDLHLAIKLYDAGPWIYEILQLWYHNGKLPGLELGFFFLVLELNSNLSAVPNIFSGFLSALFFAKFYPNLVNVWNIAGSGL